MITSDVITRVRRTFGDEAAVQVQDADVIRWINDAQVEIVKKNDAALQKTATVDLVAGTSTYALPTDLLILRSLRYKFPDMEAYARLSYKSIQQFDEEIDGWDGTLYSSGHPYLFSKFENNVTLFPTPDQSMVAGLKVIYNFEPTDVVLNTDPLALPLIYHNTIVSYCLWQASLMDEDHEVAVMYNGQFANDMDVLTERETRDPVATYPVITVLEYDL